MTGSRDWAWLMLVGSLLAASAHAAKLYSFNGKISRITGREVQVTRGSESKEFGIENVSASQRENLSVGDEVTLWYSMEARGVTTQQQQQPGRAGNLRPSAPSDTPDDSDQIPPAIQDDRAFYNARNEGKLFPQLGS